MIFLNCGNEVARPPLATLESRQILNISNESKLFGRSVKETTVEELSPGQIRQKEISIRSITFLLYPTPQVYTFPHQMAVQKIYCQPLSRLVGNKVCCTIIGVCGQWCFSIYINCGFSWEAECKWTVGLTASTTSPCSIFECSMF